MFPAPIRFFGVAMLTLLALGAPGRLAALHPPQRNPPPPPKTPEPPPKHPVHGEGCVRAGVQPHCLVLRDVKSGHLFDLLFKADRPPVGLGIEFTGVMHPGPTACMQGTAVDVTTWAHKTSIKCTPGQAGKRGERSGSR